MINSFLRHIELGSELLLALHVDLYLLGNPGWIPTHTFVCQRTPLQDVI
jgi:hypothetical protein